MTAHPHPFTPRRDSVITCFTCGRDESDPAHAAYFNSAQLAVLHMMTTGDYNADWWAGYAYAKAQAVGLLRAGRHHPEAPDACIICGARWECAHSDGSEHGPQ